MSSIEKNALDMGEYPLLRVSQELKNDLLKIQKELQREVRLRQMEIKTLHEQHAAWLQDEEPLPQQDKNFHKKILTRTTLMMELSELLTTIRAITNADMTIPHDKEGSAHWALGRLLFQHVNQHDNAAFSFNDYHLPGLVEKHQKELHNLFYKGNSPQGHVEKLKAVNGYSQPGNGAAK